MALYTVVAGNVIQIADLNQFFDLLTGLMTDQGVTLANIFKAIAGVQLGTGTPAAGPDMHSDGTNVFIETNGAGSIYLRPQGLNTTTNQAQLDSAGDLTLGGTGNLTAPGRISMAGIADLALQTVTVGLNMGSGTLSGTASLPVAYKNQCAFVVGSLSWNTDSSGPQQMLVECQVVSASQVEWRVTVFSTGHYTGTLMLVTGGF